jgi:drug/metabolite transporter (DMT)-like permease
MPGVSGPAGQLKRGLALAGAAALLFGMTAPLLKRASDGTGVFVAGGLVYLGAALAAAGLAWARRSRRDWIPRRARPRLALVAVLGAVIAPALLVAGLRRTDGATASLLLALEAPFTIVLARLFLHEFVGPRVAIAAAAITAGAGVLVGTSASGEPAVTLAGVLLVAAASLAWSLDNLLSRALADLEPLLVVALKGLLGALLSGAVAFVAGGSLPGPGDALALVTLGAFGYGVSLQLYLRAQHLVGAARTASIFATAPFVGISVAFLLGTPHLPVAFPIAAVLIAGGVLLHLSERHAHRHRHAALAHEHLHRHDDGHHQHVHHPMPAGPHSHAHSHEALEHSHPHSEDVHHRHAHDAEMTGKG